MKKENIVKILLSIGVAELVGLLSALAAGNSFVFYQNLKRPPLSPPGAVFPIVWTILYALMGFSAAWLDIYGHGTEKEKKQAKLLYTAQLFVNFLWSIVFFRFESVGGGLFVILILLVLIVLMILTFYRISKPAAYLSIPYLIWVIFATYLNAGVLFLNKPD